MKTPQRILMTTDTVGGVWSFTIDLIRSLESCNVEVFLAIIGGPLAPARHRLLLEIPYLSYAEGNYPLEWMDDPWLGVAEAGEWLLELAGEFRPSVIHLNGYCHATLPWQAPVLVTAHSCILSWWHATRDDLVPEAYEEYRRRVTAGILTADLVIAPTNAMYKALRKHYHVPFRGRVIHNGCNTHDFHASPYKQPIVLSAGRLWDDAKNLGLLNRIAPCLEWPIRVAGGCSHPCDDKYIVFSNLELLGPLTRSTLAEELAGAAIYASPALYEPFGLAVLEAALSGCALVLSDIPTYRELWEDVAIFCHANDEQAWIRTLNNLAANPLVLQKMSAAARCRAQKLSATRMGQAYLRCYRELQAREHVVFNQELAA